MTLLFAGKMNRKQKPIIILALFALMSVFLSASAFGQTIDTLSNESAAQQEPQATQELQPPALSNESAAQQNGPATEEIQPPALAAPSNESISQQENITSLAQAGNLADAITILELYKDATGLNKTPLILIHGIHGSYDSNNNGKLDLSETSIDENGKDYWAKFKSYFDGDAGLNSKYKIYIFSYLSDRYEVKEIARSMKNWIDSFINSRLMKDGRIVLLAHSMGGLVARSYMNEYNGGQRVEKLITLATPHHGTPSANHLAREQITTNTDWSVAMDAASDYYWGLTSGPAWHPDLPNRSDLRWDNYDNKMSGYICGSVDCYNNSQEKNTWLQELNKTTLYDSNIIAYSGYIYLNDPDRVNLLNINPLLLLLNTGYDHHNLRIVNIFMNEGMRNYYFLNDGLVPYVSSAGGNLNNIAARRLCDGYDHLDMRDGKLTTCSTTGKNLFDSVKDDLYAVTITCTFSITSTSHTFSSTGGTGSVTVAASDSGCVWSAASLLSWITITSGSSGTGSGTVTFSVSENTGGDRTGNITIAGQTFVITQSGASCVYTLSPANQAFDAFGGTGSVNVITSASSCIWTATSAVSWATITSGANGTGNGTVTYSISSSVGNDRTGSITIAGQTFIITQTGSVINTTTNLIINPGFESGYANWYGVILRPSAIIDSSLAPHAGSRYAWLGGYNGASDYIYQDVTIPSNAQQPYFQFWYSISTWETTTSSVYDTMAVEIRRPADNALLGTAITLSNLNKTSGWVPSLLYDLSAFKGQGIRLRFYATTDSWSNPTSFRIDDVSLSNTVTTACTFSVSPASQTFTSAGGSGSVNVAVSDSGCAWTTLNPLNWVTITSGNSGTGSGTISFTVAANTSTSSRTGTLTIAGHTFTVTQSGIVCTYTTSPAGQTFPSTGGTGSVTVVASDSVCAWTAASSLDWVTITIGGNGTGNGRVNVSVAANTGGPRTGNITIASQTYAITQAAACIYIISPTSQTFNSSAGTGSVTVTASDSSCSWTTLNPLTWATITSGSSGTGNGTVTFSVSENTTGASRTGIITIADQQTFMIMQSDRIFADVASSNAFYSYISAIYNNNPPITLGCSQNPLMYCPDNSVTRGQMAAFIIRAKYGENSTYTLTPYFSDVSATNGFFKYVQKMKDAGITSVTGTYDVDGTVTRGQMAAFIIRAKYGENFTYTATPYFSDVPATNGFFKYVQKMKDANITAVTGTYNINGTVTRGAMAAFIARAFLNMP